MEYEPPKHCNCDIIVWLPWSKHWCTHMAVQAATRPPVYGLTPGLPYNNIILLYACIKKVRSFVHQSIEV